jgi:hypothetical protein
MKAIFIDDGKMFQIQGSAKRYLTFRKNGNFSAKARRLILDKQLNIPDGYNIKNGRILKMKNQDQITKSNLTRKVAEHYGFKTLKEMKEFMVKTFQLGKNITTFTELKKEKNKQSIQGWNNDFINKLTKTLSHYKDIKMMKKIKEYKSSIGLVGSTYRLNLNKNITEDYLPDLSRVLLSMVLETIEKNQLQDNDKIKINFESNTFLTNGHRRGVYYKVKNKNAMIQYALTDLEKVLQSAESIDDVKITVDCIEKIPQGKGRNKNVLSYMEAKQNNVGVFQVNADAYCGFISLVLCPPIAKKLIPDIDKRKHLTTKHSRKDTLRRNTAFMLMDLCNISKDNETADIFDFETISQKLGICIHIWDEAGKFWLRTDNVNDVPNDDDHHVYLSKCFNHFDSIYQPKKYFQRSYICHRCEAHYNNKDQHICKDQRAEIKEVKEFLLDKHSKEKKQRVCHICLKTPTEYHRHCLNCKEDISKDGHKHKCFMTQGNLVNLPDGTVVNTSLVVSGKYIIFDVECMLLPDGTHSVNYVVAEYLDGTQFTFNNLQDFMEFLFKKDEKDNFIHSNYTVIAHYGSGYDFRFVMEWIIYNKDMVNPFTIYNGTKITYMCIKKMNLRFVDSYRFFLQPLEALPKMFELKEKKKGFFPHKFNTPENQDYVGVFPDISYYDPENMKEKKRKEFEEWYGQQKGKIFDFKKELAEYCKSDVDILRNAIIKFRENYLEVEQADPFQYITLPAFTQILYRSKFMPKDSIAVYDNSNDNQSFIALEWLQYREVIDKRKIHTCLDGKEAWISSGMKSMKVDGLDNHNNVYEFSGCYYHGCPKCNPSNSKKYEKTIQKNKAIVDAGYNLIHIWECEWYKEKKNEEVKNILEQINHIMPLRIRDAFFGGRTECFKPFVDINKMPFKAKIFYRDITSLYPWVMFNMEYPVGHHTVIKDDFDYTLKSYFGVVKCKVKPPNDLYIPVLPEKGEKLTFRLGNCLIGTWTTCELLKAIEKKYEIQEIYEVHHFENTSTDLFKGYIGYYLKIKQESSGYPKWVKTEEDKDWYIANYQDKMGIHLEKDNVKLNEGKRACAKLCLNNLWGRFGMRSFNNNKEIIRTREDVYRILKTKGINQETVDFQLFEGHNDFAIATYETFNEKNGSWMTVNPYLAVFTSSYARLKLYDALDTLGERVIYCDTDSVIYYHEDDAPLESSRESHLIHGLVCGDMLGDFTDELDGHWIIGWISGGAKSYGYEVCNKIECGCKMCGSTCCKVKGFTLTSGNSKNINFKTVVPCVRRICMGDYTQDNTLKAENFRIRYDSKRLKMRSCVEEKVWSYTNDKRVVSFVSDWMIDSLPIGHKKLKDYNKNDNEAKT